VREGALGGGATLAGCLVIPCGNSLLICREPHMAVEEVAVAPGPSVLWDGRFRISFVSDSGTRQASLVVRRLGVEGWAAIAARDPGLRFHPIPPPARPSLPAVWSARGVIAVPHLDRAAPNAHMGISAAFVPGVPLAAGRFHCGVDQGLLFRIST
jgi:tRNA(Ile)-lysidine synthase